MTYIGLDACSSGWVAAILADGELRTERCSGGEQALTAFRERHSDADRILVDIPIGLPDGGRRECDERAKALLGCRQASVFYPPARAVHERDGVGYQRANELHRAETGNGLSKQAYHLLPRIREVDAALAGVDATPFTVLESHPELCFYGLNGGSPIAYSKRSPSGKQRRRAVLRRVLEDADAVYERALDEYYRKDVARDDILDALALTAAATADSLVTLPADRDHREDRQVIVYPAPE